MFPSCIYTIMFLEVRTGFDFCLGEILSFYDRVVPVDQNPPKSRF